MADLLRNHAPDIAAMDLFVVPTIGFDLLYAFVIAGGAGFSPQLAHRGKHLFEEALKILEVCPANCDNSCYRCLRSFRNKIEHRLLDRKLGEQFLRHALYGGYQPSPADRVQSSTQILC